ncbi:TetR/AcrR family transcriptional regulator [Thalassorhabdomicrobium marinisediminis]|uniref:TetR/AcrR family transcriptional regulator n=1 Tax=Thalassorhabdomicrobium marinisediminis TaxID=2170577 RepID=UPI002492E784|nr:TetR/AcrR family transcriptional regulator [Thalassorhabdomicrobium marinisediminis]
MTKAQGAGRPRNSDSKLSKQSIIAAAMPIVQQNGVDALSFRVLADQLGVTPMAVTYHSGSKTELLADLVDAAFKDALGEIGGRTALERARLILVRYCTCALQNAHLLRAVLNDTSIMGPSLHQITETLRQSTRSLDDGDKGDVLLHLLIDYTHGFVLSATASKDNPLTIGDFLCGLDWVLDRVACIDGSIK